MTDVNERELRRLHGLMRDPRYWQKKDPGFVAVVTEGFRALYGGTDAGSRAAAGRAANAAGVTGDAHGRDLIIGHLAPGEIVVPPRALSPEVMRALRQELGDELPRFIVGSGFERRNPVSGLPAFSPENEEEDGEGMRETLFDFSVEFLKNIIQRQVGKAPLGAPDPEEQFGREPASKALDPLGLRDAVPRENLPKTGEPHGGGRKCTLLERIDPLSPCYEEPQS